MSLSLAVTLTVTGFATDEKPGNHQSKVQDRVQTAADVLNEIQAAPDTPTGNCAPRILTYSRARGVFAGLELSGAVVQQDKDSTREFYGHWVSSKGVPAGLIEPPSGAYPFLETLAKWAKEASE